MPKVTVYKVKLYDGIRDESIVSRRMATEKGAAIMGGVIIPETATEIDAEQLERGEEWTERDFVPRNVSNPPHLSDEVYERFERGLGRNNRDKTK